MNVDGSRETVTWGDKEAGNRSKSRVLDLNDERREWGDSRWRGAPLGGMIDEGGACCDREVGLEKGNGRREEISCGFAILFFHLFAKRCVNACRSNPSTAFPVSQSLQCRWAAF